METKDAIELIQRINELAAELKTAYGKRLSDKSSNIPYIIHARAKMETYPEVIQIVKELSNG